MKPRPWRYKSALALFTLALVVLSVKTVYGLGDWAINTVLPSGSTWTPTPTAPAPGAGSDDPVGAWPH